MSDPRKAHIVYSADERFAPMLGVSLVSLYENSRDMDEIALTLLDGGIGPENRARIEAVSRAYGRSAPRWVPAPNVADVLGMPVSANRGHPAQYARLFLARAVEGDRALYLDSDVMLRASVRSLWNLDLKGRTVAALLDAYSRAYRANIGLTPREGIFNYGVMLTDLAKWRREGVEARILDVIRRNRGDVEMSDLGALNAALSRDTLPLSPRFNAVTIFFDFDYREMLRYRKPPEYYPEAEVRLATADPAVVHFTGSFLSARPWEADCRHPFADEWLRYAAMSPWDPFPLRACKKRLGARLLGSLPRPLMLLLAGMLQAYARPLWNRIHRWVQNHGK